MKTMAGTRSRARAKSSFIRRSDSPNHFERISAALAGKNEAWVCDASTRAMVVLPLPGGPNKRMPVGGAMPNSRTSCGFSMNRWMDCSLRFVSTGRIRSFQPSFGPP